MTHVRTLIRRNLIAQLTAAPGIPTVYDSRTRPLKKDERADSISVYSTEEESELISTGPARALRRQVELNVVGAVEAPGGSAGVSDATDDLAAAIEAAITDPKFAGNAKGYTLASTTTDSESDRDREIGVVELVFIVEYHTALSDPTVAV